MMNRDLVPVRDLSIAVLAGEIKESPLSQADYQRIKLYFASRQTPGAMRDLVLLATLKGTGLRIAEVLRLEPHHLRRNGPVVECLVRRGKQRRRVKGRMVSDDRWTAIGLHPELAGMLTAYIRLASIPPGARVFPISDRAVRYVFAAAGKASIGRSVHPHEFRALFATELMERGVPVAAIANLLGHSADTITRKYYLKPTTEKQASYAALVTV